MSLRITVLCDNSVGALSGTLGEHGFAALIEPSHGGEPILFDTGQGQTLLHNAQRMHRDLSRVRRVVLSHGHYDHAGGLAPLLKEKGAKEVWAHPGIFSARYRVKDTGEHIPIGSPQSRAELEAMGAAFNLASSFREIRPDIFLTGEVPRRSAFEKGDAGIYCDSTGCAPDLVPDDQSLVLRTKKGLVLLLGCCHAGIINTLEHVAERLGQRDFYAVVGGMHLGFCAQLQIDETVAHLKGYAIKKLAVSHCTGFAAAARLFRDLPKGFHLAQVGYTLDL
ncbi:MAG TPA: MBL fold metallo-hydrolase [Desulfuromonadaceae bacterium]|jgi:7,8-dihydropterin-6-yl-methyl-4-(beta-D-ribofuranosyl)aminobenzene 5'-phosphate synthase